MNFISNHHFKSNALIFVISLGLELLFTAVLTNQFSLLFEHKSFLVLLSALIVSLTASLYPPPENFTPLDSLSFGDLIHCCKISVR